MVWGTMAEMLLAGPPLQSICREAAPGRIVRTAMAKMLAEPLRMALDTMAEMLLAGPRGQNADAADGKERKRITACRCG